MPNDPILEPLNDLRAKVLRGEVVTREEYKSVVQSIRQHRRAGDLSATAKKKAAGGAPVDSSSFFNTPV